MQVPIIIPIHEDELLYSWMIRLAVANGLGHSDTTPLTSLSETFINKRIERRIVVPNYDCNNNISSLFQSLDSIEDKLSEMFMHHTPYSIYRHFFNDMRQANYVHQALYPHIDNFPSLLGSSSSSRLTFHACICPECAKEDIQKYGYYYLHTDHHLPDVQCCHKHRSPLLQFTGRKTKELDDINDYTIQLAQDDDSLKYAKFVADCSKCDTIHLCDYLSESLSDKIHSLGFNNILEDDAFQYLRSQIHGCSDTQIRQVQRWLSHPFDSFACVSLSRACLFLFGNFENFYSSLNVDNGAIVRVRKNKQQVFDRNGYDIIGTFFDSLILMKSQSTGERFFTTPYGFEIGWREPSILSQLTEKEMVANLVSASTNGNYCLKEYTSMGVPAKIHHNVCGRDKIIKPSFFLNQETKCDCERIWTKERAFDFISKNCGDDFELLEFTKRTEEALFLCKNCGTVIGKMFYLMQRHPYCPECEKIAKKKKLEQERIDAENHKAILKDKVSGLLLEYQTEVYKNSEGHYIAKRNLSHHKEYFQEQLQALVGDEYELIGDYVDIKTRTLCRHNRCGKIFEITPASFIRGRRCNCRKPLSEEKFREFVYQASYKKYSIIGNMVNYNHCSYNIINNETGETQTLPKMRIMQELVRPTPSPVLPCDRPVILDPYEPAYCQSVYSWLKENYADKDIFAIDEIDCKALNIPPKQIYDIMRKLKAKGLVWAKSECYYCLSDYQHTPIETAYYRFCSKNGQRIGYFTLETLIADIVGIEHTGKINVRCNFINHSKYFCCAPNGVKMRTAKTRFVCNNDNVNDLIMLEILSAKYCLWKDHISAVKAWAFDHGYNKQSCLDLMQKYNISNNKIVPNLDRLFISGEALEKRNVPPGYLQKGWTLEQVKEIYGADRPIIVDLCPIAELSRSVLRSQLQYLVQDNKLKRVARGYYVLPESQMTFEEAIQSKYLYEPYGHRIGYLSGETFLYLIGLKDKEPEHTYITSNLRIDSKSKKSLQMQGQACDLLVRGPKCEVTDANYKILPVLDVLTKFPDHTENVMECIKRYLKENDIDYDDCRNYTAFYRDVVLERLKEIYGIVDSVSAEEGRIYEKI